MRIALALASLFAISCSTSNKYIFFWGSEDQTGWKFPSGSEGWGGLKHWEGWEGTNDNDLRDRRPHKESRNDADHDEQLERALKQLERALEEVRRALR
ncbi:MAG: hypothetical protein ACI89X_000982 [Planctomycetota bacterium]|jgi:hypothetical protein